MHAAKSVPCADCGGTFDPVCMDFDHRPGEVKSRSVARMVGYPHDEIRREIAKCDVVCANCHRLRTKSRGYVYRSTRNPDSDRSQATLDLVAVDMPDFVPGSGS